MFNTTERKKNLTFCINYFDTGTYFCSDCREIPWSIIIFARIEFVLAVLVILINTGEIFLIVRLLLKIQKNPDIKSNYSQPLRSFAVGGDPLTLCTFAVCDCLLGEGYLFEISCVLFTGEASRPICKWTDRVGVFLIKFGGIYMPTALLNEACIKRLIVFCRPIRTSKSASGEREYASPRFVGISWAICLFVCFLDTVVQAMDESIYDIYYSTIKYCILGLDGIFYLIASLIFVVEANKRRLSRSRRLYQRRSRQSLVFESRARWRQRCVWNANFGVQFFIFFVCIAIFLSVNVFWFTQELTHRLDATNETNCLILLVLYKLIGLTFGLGKPFIFFLGLRTIRRFGDDFASPGTSVRTISEGSVNLRNQVLRQEDGGAPV